MTIELNYNKNNKILTMKAKGDVTIHDIETYMLKLFSSEEFSQNVNSLWDIRELSFENIDIAFLKQLVALRKKYNKNRGDAKIALLSDYMLAAPILKLYVILSKKLTQKNRTFSCVKEAELWLCQP